MKKLASQHFSSFFENESISVTSAFFTLFSRPDWAFDKMDIPKMSKIDFRTSNLEKLFFKILLIDEIINIMYPHCQALGIFLDINIRI
jgi:hypothetical protein